MCQMSISHQSATCLSLTLAIDAATWAASRRRIMVHSVAGMQGDGEGAIIRVWV